MKYLGVILTIIADIIVFMFFSGFYFPTVISSNSTLTVLFGTLLGIAISAITYFYSFKLIDYLLKK